MNDWRKFYKTQSHAFRKRNPTITMADRWAIDGVKREYGHNWGMAWWREVIQNSVDAGSSEIRLSINKKDNVFIIIAQDNGVGMNRDVLVSKFFSYGDTGKVGSEGRAGTGGFGVAKALLLFPWQSWKVTTRDLVVMGSGRKWEFICACGNEIHGVVQETTDSRGNTHNIITDKSLYCNTCIKPEYGTNTSSQPFFQGTRLEVVMSADDAKNINIANAVHVIETSFIPNVSFWVSDDANPPRQIKAERTGELRPETIEGNVEVLFHLDESINNNYIYIRHVNPVNGARLLMFQEYVSLGQYLGIPGYLMFDVMLPSLDAFAASRNKIESQALAQLLESLKAKIIKSMSELTRKKKGLFIKKFLGDEIDRYKADIAAENIRKKYGPQTEVDWEAWNREVKEASEKEAVRSRQQTSELPPSEASQTSQTEAENQPPAQPATATTTSETADSVAEAIGEMQEKGEAVSAVVEAATQQLLWKPDYILVNDVENFEVPSDFWPQTMTKEIMKLLRVWAEFCRLGLSLMGSTKKFGVGFYFSTQAHAAFLAEDGTKLDGWVMLNPLKSFKKSYYSRTINIKSPKFWDPNDAHDLNWLYAAVIHELTHMIDGISGHDDSFAYAQTYNQGVCGSGYKSIYKISKSIKVRELPGLTRIQLTKAGIQADQPHAFRFRRGPRPADISFALCSICGVAQKDHPKVASIDLKKVRHRKIIPGRGFYRVVCTFDEKEQKFRDFATSGEVYEFFHTIAAEEWRCQVAAYYYDIDGTQHKLDDLMSPAYYALSKIEPDSWSQEAVKNWDSHHAPYNEAWRDKPGKTIFQRYHKNPGRGLRRRNVNSPNVRGGPAPQKLPKSPWYRGINVKGKGSDVGLMGKGLYLTWHQPTAEAFAFLAAKGRKKNTKVLTYEIPDINRLKIIEWHSPEMKKILASLGVSAWDKINDPVFAFVLTLTTKEKGYDGIIDSGDPYYGMVLFDPSSARLAN